MEAMETVPRLRVMPVPVEVQGKRMLLFQDQERISEESVLMPEDAALIIQFFDGNHTLRQIQEEIMRQSGQLVDSKVLEEIQDQLDEHLLLDSPRLHDHLEKLNDAWAAQKARAAYHAGQGYPDTKEELTGFLDAFYNAPEGPGEQTSLAPSKIIKGIVAPHMDIRDSGACTAFAFKALAEETDAELFVIFGTGHMEPQRMFVPSDKDFETPLGVAKTDKELVERIAKLRRDRNPINDYIHKQEHSIEFMVVFLQHALQGKRDFTILPILASGMSTSVATRTAPSGDPGFRDFMEALKQALTERDQKVCFIAGADLAHLGPRYGDKENYAPIRMAEEEETDRKMLEPLLVGDKEGFFQQIANVGDRRKICGLAPVYSMMEVCGADKGELLKWGYWHDQSTHSVVTYTSMTFY